MKKVKQILSVLLIAVMLFGVMPIMSFAVSDAPTFSVSKLSETNDEVKISFNLESGCFGSLDGHDSSSYFWIMPVRVIDFENTADLDSVAEMRSTEISIEEDDVAQFAANK